MLGEAFQIQGLEQLVIFESCQSDQVDDFRVITKFEKMALIKCSVIVITVELEEASLPLVSVRWWLSPCNNQLQTRLA